MASSGFSNANTATASKNWYPKKGYRKTQKPAGLKRKRDADGDIEMPDVPPPSPKRHAGSPFMVDADGDVIMTDAPPLDPPQGIPVMLFGGRIGYLDPNSKPLYGPNDHAMILDKPHHRPRGQPRQPNKVKRNHDPSHHSAPPPPPRGPPPSGPERMNVDHPNQGGHGPAKKRGKKRGKGKGKGKGKGQQGQGQQHYN